LASVFDGPVSVFFVGAEIPDGGHMVEAVVVEGRRVCAFGR
jgi:predicted ester cyclase